jgi:hypothetical protein
MGGMFLAGDHAFVTVSTPKKLITPAVGGNPIAQTSLDSPTNSVIFYLVDGAGVDVAVGSCAALPEGVSIVNFFNGQYTFKLLASYLIGKGAGCWSLTLENTNDMPNWSQERSTWMWGGAALGILEQISSRLGDPGGGSSIAGVQQQIDAKISASRFFQYLSASADPVPKSKLWLRAPDDSAWVGYWPVYANTTTGGIWPIPYASIVWPTTLQGMTSNGELVADATGPT